MTSTAQATQAQTSQAQEPATRYLAAALIATPEGRPSGGASIISDAFLDVDASGVIRALGERAQAPPAAPARVVDLGRVVLAPGQINAHSHVFQRRLRARTEHLDAQRPQDDFWSWRELMYQEAQTLTPQSLREVALRTYREMAATGITSVGEFHYVHHQPDGRPYEPDADELAHVVIQAARQVGLRITLLRVAYQRAGAHKPATALQRRFIDAQVQDALASVQRLRAAWAHDEGVRVGLAPHSVRAVERPWLEACASFAQDQGIPLHIHACEQRAELAQCVAEHGLSPIELLHECGLLAMGAGLTIIHGTHLSLRDLELLAQHKPTICACPSTERNLGDGFLPALQLIERDVPLCVGSDSHAHIDPWDELRLIELHERLRYERRNVLASALAKRLDPCEPSPARLSASGLLWDMGTRHGARALGQATGQLRAGMPADLVALDLDHDSVADTPTEHLLDALVFGAKPGAVCGAWVQGRALLDPSAHHRS